LIRLLGSRAYQGWQGWSWCLLKGDRLQEKMMGSTPGKMCHVTCRNNHVTVKGKLSRCHLKSGAVGVLFIAHCTGARSSCWISANELSLMDINWRDRSWFTITWCVHSRIELVWGLAVVVITALIL
jgi:hypothetical protein